MDEINKIIDVIVPCYNVEETIERCIKNLCNQSLSKDRYNCFFINDHSDDRTGSLLDKYKQVKNIKIIHHEKNLGLAAARNSGLKVGSSNLVAFLDGDMVVGRDWLESFLPYLNKGVVAVMGDNIPPGNISLTPIEKYYFGNLRGARKYKDGERIPLQYMLFGNAILKREVLNKCGFFDESMKKYGGEDIDLSSRIWNYYPKSFVFSKNSDAVHFHRRSFSEFCHSMQTYGKYNLPKLIKKHPHYKNKFAADWIFSLKGRLLFNLPLKILVHLIIKIYPLQILLRYIVIESTIRGARSSEELIDFNS
tara:strand:- start:80 stop:1000 length:921 start_codon:yes stop_codon:yes gene_type:complete